MSQDATTDATPTTDAALAAAGPAPVPTPPPTPVATEPTPEPAPDEPQETDDPNDARLSKVRREAAARRVQAREATERATAAETERDSLKAILEGLNKVLNPEAPADVDPAAQVTELTAGNQTLTEENASLRQELLVRDLATDANANAKALLDSMSFRDTLRALDASADDYRAQVASAITAAVDANNSLRAVQGTSRGGAENAGGASTDGAVTPDQFKAMGYAERTALYNTNPTLFRQLNG